MRYRPGSHRMEPGNARLQVRTGRDGVAQRLGHDLVFDVASWRATVTVDSAGQPVAVELGADARTLELTAALDGVKPLTERDRREILRTVERKVLRDERIVFCSRAVEAAGGRLHVAGELTLAGVTRPARFELVAEPDGRVHGVVPLSQTEWGIEPYRAFMGALRVRDTVEVSVEARLPAA